VAGVIKMTQAMRAGAMPKTLHVDAPSSKVDWEAGEIELLTEQLPWQANGAPRRAGVSSFGISGTNAHVILEEAPAIEMSATRPLSGPIPFVLSAKAEPALAAAAERLVAHIEDNAGLDPTDLAHSLATTRSSLEHRAVALASDREELLEALRALAAGAPSPSLTVARAKEGKLACLFTGQGSQRPGMGAELFESDPVYAAAVEEACALFDDELGEPLKGIVFATGEEAARRLGDTAFAQPALFVTELALYRTLASRGLKPDVLAGHSIGEIVAAHLSGVLSLPDAARLVAARGRLMGGLPGGGAMLAVSATEQEAVEWIHGREGEIAIAAINSPVSLVLSGSGEAVEAAGAEWEARGRKTKRLAVSHAFHSPLMEPMLAEFAEVAASLDYGQPRIPIVSNVSGELLGAEQATDPAYWVRHVREPVRFADAVATLAELGTSAYLELGPEPVLCTMVAETLEAEGRGGEAAPISTLREGRPEPEAIAGALAGAHAAGAKLDWEAFFAGTGAKRVLLPTYPFQRTRFWVGGSTAGGFSDPASVGQSATGHPLLGAAIEDPQGQGLTLTGRFSASTHPWLADQRLGETSILPGAAFLELALHAAERVGARQVAELAMEAPLVLPERDAVRLQVMVEGAGEGEWRIAIHSRPEGGGEDLAQSAEWTCHARGELSAEPPAAIGPAGEWPPGEAERVDADSLYDRLADRGLEYGPAFQGLTAAWRLGEEIFAEVSLAEGQREEAAGYGIHPALLEAAQSSELLLGGDGQELRLPSSWSGVALEAVGAQELRLQLRRQGEAGSLRLWDQAGAAVGRVGSLRTAPVPAEQLRDAGQRPEALLEVEWAAVVPTEQGAMPPDVEPLHCETGSAGDADAARDAARGALRAVQWWLAEGADAKTRLALITQGAMATTENESADPVAATIWGLVRSAQSEHPGRFALIDSDGSEASRQALAAALAAGAEEPQLALREGSALAPRLARSAASRAEEAPAPAFDPDRTVLISGGTGGLGALLARHLAVEHHVRHLLLISRSGPEAPGAEDLAEELGGLGAEASIVACDASDRTQLKAVLDAVPDEHPLGAVIHAAGVLDDATIESLGEEELARVFAPKVDAAWHLHELTRSSQLSTFAMFSAAAGTLGGPGQGNYAAANAYLDALAGKRRAEGLPATSIVWGLWSTASGMSAGLGEGDLKRMERGGIRALSEEQGLRLFDAALAADRTLAVAIGTNATGLRSLASVGALPPMLRGLAGAFRRRAATASTGLSEGLAALSGEEREQAVLELVRAQIAILLGHGSAQAIGPDRAFADLGFDSLTAVELRNRLAAATGLQLPPTLIFDHPTPAELAAFLRGGLDPAARSSSSDGPGGRTFPLLLERATRQGRFAEFDELIAAASRLRETFASPPPAETSPRAIDLAAGPAAPSLILLSSVVAISGPQEYLRLAQEFQGERAVRLAPHRGFVDGELLPADFGVMAEAQAETILRHGLDGPIALVGYSSGAWIAHAVASRLERIGSAPAAVALLDPPSSASVRLPVLERILTAGLSEGDRAPVPLDDARLTAQAAYLEMAADWRPERLATPVLMVRAEDSIEEMEDRPGEREAFWGTLTSVVDVAGDHTTVMTDHAGTTAQAVRDFLRDSNS
jgi:acyl transferase domain-containing protein/acyl carrier protein